MLSCSHINPVISLGFLLLPSCSVKKISKVAKQQSGRRPQAAGQIWSNGYDALFSGVHVACFCFDDCLLILSLPLRLLAVDSDSSACTAGYQW